MPDADQSARLRATMERFNTACDWVAGVCFAWRQANVFEARKFAYHEARGWFGLSSQQAQLAIKAACDAYNRKKATRVRFLCHAAIPDNARSMGFKAMGFKGIDCVLLLTLGGRVVVPFVLGKYQAERMPMAKGQCKLVLREDGRWFLIVTVDVPEGTPIRRPTSSSWT